MTDLDRQELEEIVRSATAGHGEAGFGVAVLQGDRLHEVAIGLANPELGIPMTDDTLVQIGSSAKLLNAALVMRLVELGMLDLDQPVAEVIEGFRLADDVATKTVTLRHCLTMTSGMDGGPFEDFGSDDGCLARYVAELGTLPHLFPPGGGFSYSNAGVIVAGHAAEAATGQRWDELLREHILFPTRLEHIETLAEALVFHRVAVGTDPDGDVIRPWSISHSMGPAGSTCAATAGDLARFAGVFLSEGRNANGGPVLSPETVGAMTQPAVPVATGFPAEHWCLGPGWTDTGTHVVLGHPGFNISGSSVLWWVPALQVAVACVTNTPTAFNEIIDCARTILTELGCRPPGDPEPQPDQIVDHLDDFVGVYDSGVLSYEVMIDGGGLYLRARGREILHGHDVTTRLVPVGRHGFLPQEPLVPGFDAPQAIAFGNYAGVGVLLNGNAAAPRRETAAGSTG